MEMLPLMIIEYGKQITIPKALLREFMTIIKDFRVYLIMIILHHLELFFHQLILIY